MGRKYQRRSPELTKRLLNNKVAIDNWLEIKMYQLPYSIYERIKASLTVTDPTYLTHLTEQEKFIRNLALVYKKNFRTWPVVFSNI